MTQLHVVKIDGEKQQDANEVNLRAWRTVQIPSNARCRSAKKMLFASDNVVWISWQ
jgi:hypothetical protein